jgi:splicing factor 1
MYCCSSNFTIIVFFFLFAVYGPDGKRQNTRAIRYREKFSRQRQDLLDQLLKFHNPNKTMMSNHPTVFFQNKRTVKVPIPIEDHPNYNFIGLIIGPRGKTQKELEAKTGCKIAIRGRGSVKTGARGRRDGRINPGDDDPLHVVITGDDPDSVTAAESMIRDMLIVIDDEKNVHKQQQLRELALLNGTLKESDDVFCGHCGDKGHRTFECPKRLSFAKNAVKCAICGDTSHPTSDCKKVMITAAAAASNAASNSAVDQDYQNFLAELEGKKNSNTEHDTDVGGPPAINLPPPPPPIQVASASQQSLPPPPVTTTSTVNLQPPSNMPPPLLDVHLPPLPTLVGLPPPPQTGVFNQQQLPPASYGHQYGTFPSQHLAPQQQQAHPQHVAVQPGQETAAWDPNAYFGTGSGIGGAGGFNWWEQ